MKRPLAHYLILTIHLISGLFFTFRSIRYLSLALSFGVNSLTSFGFWYPTIILLAAILIDLKIIRNTNKSKIKQPWLLQILLFLWPYLLSYTIAFIYSIIAISRIADPLPY